MSAEGELVEAGHLRVDPRRAFAILRRSQLPDDYWRPLLWFRLAAACGARRAELKTAMFQAAFRFDGEPLPARLLAEPFGRMTAGDDSPAARWLAWALVHSLCAGAALTLSSGSGDSRRAFAYGEDGAASPAEPEPGADTCLVARWRVPLKGTATAPWLWQERDQRVSYPRLELARGVPFLLRTQLGEVVPWERRRGFAAGVVRDGARRVRVELGVPPRLALWHWGVRAHQEPLGDLALPAAVDVDDPGLVLDASLSAPVQDDAFWRALAAGRRAAERFMEGRLRRHALAMRQAGRLLLERPGLRREWAPTGFLGGRARGRLPLALRVERLLALGGAVSVSRLRVARAARFCGLLRQAALASLRGTRLDQADALRAALWRAPLLFSATGLPLSLSDLDLDRRAPAFWTKGGPAPAGAGAGVVWVLAASDRAFARAFPRRACRVE